MTVAVLTVRPKFPWFGVRQSAQRDHVGDGIPWHAAKDYADRAGVSLLTEALWEKAARGVRLPVDPQASEKVPHLPEAKMQRSETHPHEVYPHGTSASLSDPAQD